jgi:hypothetical protein
VAGSVIVVKKKDRFDRLVMIGMVVDYRSQQKVKLRFERLGMVRMIVDYVVTTSGAMRVSVWYARGKERRPWYVEKKIKV